MSYFKPISISLSPNVEKDDLHLALNLIIRPWLWKRGKAIGELENEFKKYLGVNPVRNSPPIGPSGAQSAGEISNGVKYAVSFNSGRSAFYAILKSLNLDKGGEVLLQAFTCNAVPNPILWADLEPIYVDCDEKDFNISVSDLEAKISPKARAVVIQHTFGLPADIGQIKSICDAKNLILIEDCAHSLGAEFNYQKVGTFGKAAFFSFSRDKVISSVYGGMAVTNDEEIGRKLQDLQKQFGMPSRFWVFQQILHPILLHYFILPIYNFLDLGKIFLVLAQVAHVLSKAVSFKEKRGQKPDYFPKALPNGLAMMALNQFNKLEKFNSKRHRIAMIYYEELKNTAFKLPEYFEGRKNIFLRFTIKHKNANEIIYQAWHKQNILLGDWYTTPIAPFDTKIDQMHYKMGMCKNAEFLSKQTLNLPTHVNISKEDIERIVDFLKQWK